MKVNKILYAKKSLPKELDYLKYKIVKIDDLQTLAGLSEFVHKKVTQSISDNGMMWPITVCKYENYWDDKIWIAGGKHTEFSQTKLGVTNGNQRVYYAKQNEYTHIHAIEVKSRDERDKINDVVYTNPYKYP